MLIIKIIDARVQTLLIPAKANKSVIVDLRNYPQEDDHVTLHCRANYYRDLCFKRKGKCVWH